MLPPNNLAEMVEYIKIRTKLELESDEKKEDINLIGDNIAVLGNLYLFIYLFIVFISLFFTEQLFIIT